MERIIGRYTGNEKGPLVVCFGGIHGNEPAGIEALELVFNMLAVEPITNPDFYFKGRLLGLKGNVRAYQKGQRFLQKDLNRQWTKEKIERILKMDAKELKDEDAELKELLTYIQREVKEYQPEQLIILDIHTTTAAGGSFVIATDDPFSLEIGQQMHAPVIKGFLKSVQGTTLHYFTEEHFSIPTTAVCFEAGQHNENLSVNRAIAAIIACLRGVGCVDPAHIESKHDKILIEYAKGLPDLCELILAHPIQPDDKFVMRPGYTNFQKVKKGEILAEDKRGVIVATADARILMPFYQQQGDDGFFLIKDL